VITFGAAYHQSGVFNVEEIHMKYESGDKYYRTVSKHHVIALMDVQERQTSSERVVYALTQSSLRETPLQFDYFLLSYEFDADLAQATGQGATYQFDSRNANPSSLAVPIAWSCPACVTNNVFYILFHDSTTGDSWYYMLNMGTDAEWVVKQSTPDTKVFSGVFS
jgi:hypothetical protein